MLPLLVALTLSAAPDRLLADFEGDDYGDWTVEGTAVGTGPARGTLPRQMPVSGYRGEGLVNSYRDGDGAVGRLVSPPFTLDRDYLAFLVGGGQHPDETCLNLRVDGRMVLTVTGPNDRAGGSEALAEACFDVRPWRGRQAVIEIVDAHRGGWGHLNIDHLVLTDTAPTPPIAAVDLGDAPSLTITQPWLAVRCVGGLEVRVEDQLIFRARPEDRPRWLAMDVTPYLGQTVTLQLSRRDHEGERCQLGPVPLSDLRLLDLGRSEEFAMELTIRERYLLWPVRNGAPKAVVTIDCPGRRPREFDIELAGADEPDWYAFDDVSEYLGRTIRIATREPLERTVAARLRERIRQSPVPVEGDDLYREALRPRFHLTSRRGWNNDPNGMTWHDGTWHVYYQHNPFGIGWGNMHWGHFTSPDLVHWTEQPIALRQNGLGDMIFSGGGNVDLENTAGWQTGDRPPLFVSFTSTGRGECLAYSTDGGTTFVEPPGNPILAHPGRDPKIIWYAPGRHWTMVVYDETDGGMRYVFWTSPDLRTWTRGGEVAGLYECPDLFELPLDGDPARRRWVLYGHERRADGWTARASYLVGSFDGRSFTPDTPIVSGHLGPHFYAAQTFTNAPGGRVIQLGWLAGATYPNMPFSQGFTVPLELGLITTPDGPRLTYAPVVELEALREESTIRDSLSPAAAGALLAAATDELLDLVLEIEPAGTPVGLNLRGPELSWSPTDSVLRLGDERARVDLVGGVLRLRALIDRGVLEVFAGDGRVSFSRGGAVFSPGALNLAAGDGALVRRLEIHRLRSIHR